MCFTNQQSPLKRSILLMFLYIVYQKDITNQKHNFKFFMIRKDKPSPAHMGRKNRDTIICKQCHPQSWEAGK